jgi:trehalose synthase
LNNAKCPGKLVELMKSGRAIVASRVGQIIEYIEDQKSGILVDPTDISGFSSQVVRLLRNDDLRKRLGVNAQNRILNSFNWDDLMCDFKLAVFGNNQCENAWT